MNSVWLVATQFQNVSRFCDRSKMEEQLKACKVDESQLSKWIDDAKGAIQYLGPAITENLANRILLAEQRTGQHSNVVVQLDAEMDRCGFGDTAGIRVLFDTGTNVKTCKGLRLAAFSAPGIGVVWSPIAKCVDPIGSVELNGIWMDEIELPAFWKWMGRIIGKTESVDIGSKNLWPEVQPTDDKKLSDSIECVQQSFLDVSEMSSTNQRCAGKSMSETVDQSLVPCEPTVELNNIETGALESVETQLQEHPPRNFKEEKYTEVYQSYVGFIEMRVTGASLSNATTLAIPKELTELGLENNLRDRLSERMRIDLRESVDLGVSRVNKRVDAFREIFTRQLGQPLGRIYKKSDWPIMQAKWKEIDSLVKSANDSIFESMDGEVTKILDEAAKEWSEAISVDGSRGHVAYSHAKIKDLLTEQWNGKPRARHVELQMFAKDLTWATLNDENVREKINEAFPEICKTGLFKRCAAYRKESDQESTE